ncbi:MAG: DsbA family protein [Nanoarchaeota archaeon]|nr:DsbA family protein [Nanoarchaeota archaeon]
MEIKKKTLYKILAVTVVVVVLILIIRPIIPTNEDGEGLLVFEDTSLFPSIGPIDAQNVVIELSDYQCPYCVMVDGGANWTKETQYINQYGSLIGTAKKVQELAENGEIRFIYVPLAFLGDESINAAEAAYCAGDQGKYFEMHDAIFAASTGPTENDGKYSKGNLKIIAQSISEIDEDLFASCLDSNKNLKRVKQALSLAETTGLKISTPQFWINGAQVPSSWPAIEAAIKA